MTIDDNKPKISSYLNYLPAVFQEGDNPNGDSFIGKFLYAFELILSGKGNGEIKGFDEIIDEVPALFDPRRDDPTEKSSEFLPWLANWVAFSLREDWDDNTKREFIDKAAGLYRLRGTKAGLKAMLGIYSDLDVHYMGEVDLESLVKMGFLGNEITGKVEKATSNSVTIGGKIFEIDLATYEVAPEDLKGVEARIKYTVDEENILTVLDFEFKSIGRWPIDPDYVRNEGGAWKRGEREDIQILEFNDPFRVKVLEADSSDKIEDNTVVGVNTMVGEGPPHYFLLKMYLWDVNEDILWKKLHGIRAIVDLHKPAHTYYDIQIEIPTLQIKIHSTIGLDTLIGSDKAMVFGEV